MVAGQRELIIGDRQNRKPRCYRHHYQSKGTNVFALRGGRQKNSPSRSLDRLRSRAPWNIRRLSVGVGAEQAPLQYIAPIPASRWVSTSGSGKHASSIYDDFNETAPSVSAVSYCSAGRRVEKLSGNVFYLHSRLLERAAKLSDKEGGAVSPPFRSSKPKRVTFGLHSDECDLDYRRPDLLDTAPILFGIRPAITLVFPFPRVGGNAQIKAMKQVAVLFRLSLAHYRKHGGVRSVRLGLRQSDADMLARGERMVALLKQGQYSPYPVEKQYRNDLRPRTAEAWTKFRWTAWGIWKKCWHDI